jgi:drug/metabolite transporter (DMT)-like permease
MNGVELPSPVSRLSTDKPSSPHLAATSNPRLLPFGMAVSAQEIIPAEHVGPRADETRWITDSLLLLMAIIWGVNFSVIKFGTQFIAPLAFNGARIPIAVGAQFGVARAMRLPPIARGDAMRLFALGLLGNGMYQVLFILGIARSRVATTALVIAATPAFVALIGRLFGSERLTRRQWAGIACQMAGCSTVVLGAGRATSGSDSLLGSSLLLLAALSWSIYAVRLKSYSHRIHPMQIGAWTMLGGALVVCTVAIPAIAATPWTTLPAGFWMALLYSAILAMVVAYMFYYRGLRVLGATRTAMYSNLQPLVAGAVAWIALNEVPTGPQLLGATLIVSGLVATRA